MDDVLHKGQNVVSDLVFRIRTLCVVLLKVVVA